MRGLVKWVPHAEMQGRRVNQKPAKMHDITSYSMVRYRRCCGVLWRAVAFWILGGVRAVASGTCACGQWCGLLCSCCSARVGGRLSFLCARYAERCVLTGESWCTYAAYTAYAVVRHSRTRALARVKYCRHAGEQACQRESLRPRKRARTVAVRSILHLPVAC